MLKIHQIAAILIGHLPSWNIVAVSSFLYFHEKVETVICFIFSIRRPDYCLGPHLRQMLSYGCTRLEIGVQSTYEDVARDTNRGHTVAAVADCFCLAKDAGFKVMIFLTPNSL